MGALAIGRKLTKRRNLVGIGIFILLVSRVAYLHYERNNLWEEILSKYDSDKANPRLNSMDLIQFLQDSGVNVTQSQLQSWLGSIDNEQDGYDEQEVLQVVDFFDDMESWKGAGRGNLATISKQHLPGLSAAGDVVFLCVVGGLLVYFLVNSEAMEKRVIQTSFVSAVKVASMKSKWKNLDSTIDGFNAERQQLTKKLADLQAESQKAVEQAATEGGRATVEVETSNKKLEEARNELERVSKCQADAEKELKRLREDTENHITEAHMSAKTKLQAMRTMLKGVDAVGAANPFKGAGQGQYNSSGAKTGFAMKGGSGSRILNGETQVATGFRMESFVFGFPTENDIVFYEVDRKKDLLGEGADCAYKCRDIATKEQFAVKIYDIKGSSQKRQIVNDLRANQSVADHPHIVRYHAVVETEEQIFVLMELIPGKDLFSHIVESGGLAERRSAFIFHQLCEALIFCHSHDIVHGDVKPENAMVIGPELCEEKLHTKLIDFGFACFMDNEEDDKKAVGDVYSPAEALNGQPSSKAVDSFRLGCTLYVMLMGTYPFQRHCRDLAERQAGKVLKYPKWNTLSAESKDLVEKLCRDRLPVDEAQKHPWVLQNLKPLV